VALALAQKELAFVRQIDVEVTEYGRIESIPSVGGWTGIVLAAPHGSFDEHTAEIARGISERAGVAAVIARGFTPTETPGWRINVNRPTERHYPGGEIEIRSARAREVYEKFREAVFRAARGPLSLYIDIHQNGRERDIEVATLGVSAAEAAVTKQIYRELRDQALANAGDVRPVELRIEPLDPVQIGAWAAKAHGILPLARKALHFEFPLYETLERVEARAAYGRILECLVRGVAGSLLTGIRQVSVQSTVAGRACAVERRSAGP
jgi:hypothetical protein